MLSAPVLGSGRRRAQLGAVMLALLGTMAALAPTASARQMYVAEERSGAVTAVDLGTDTVSGKVEGTGSDTLGLAITPDGREVYVTGFESNDVSVIDTATNTVSAKIPLGAGAEPVDVAIAPDGRHAYVAESGADKIAVIDTSTHAVAATVQLAAGSTPRVLAASPDGRRLYAGDVGSEPSDVSVIDTAANAVTATIPLSGFSFLPFGSAISPDGKRLYLVGLGSGEAVVIDTTTNSITGTIAAAPGGTAIGGIAISPDGKRVYMTDLIDDELAVADAATDQVTGRIPLSASGLPFRVVLSPDGARAYVSYISGSEIEAIDTAREKSLGAFGGFGEALVALAIVPDQPPRAALAPATGVQGSPIGFDAAASSDPDGTIAAFDWSFGDGQSASDGGPTTSHAYAAAGTFPASVTVTDQEGCSNEFVFTGQTAYCNGSSVARRTIQVPVAARPLPPPPPLPKAFLLRKLTKNQRNGTVRVRLWLSGAGILRVRGAHLRSIRRQIGEARTLTVIVRPSHKGKKALRRHRRLRVRMRITFTPDATPPRTVSKRLTLRYRRHAGRRH